MRELLNIFAARRIKKVGLASKIAAAVFIIAAVSLCVSITASAKAETITETVTLANVKKNQTGEGYYWDNINDVLTLNGLNIDTEDDFGLKLPDNATVVLVGSNSISASKAALVTTGNTIFKGSGSLTVISDGVGIMLTDATELGKVSFLSGSYKISAGSDGISSEKVKLYISGGTMNITLAQGGSYAIKSRLVELNNSNITANGAIYSVDRMVINNVTLNLSVASGDALLTDAEFRVSNVVLKSGNSADSLTTSSDSSYSGGGYVMTTPTYVEQKYSTVFGGTVPAWVDYIVFAGAAIGLTAVIALPLIIHRRKYLRRLEQLKSAK
jgi:hypothetical protein